MKGPFGLWGPKIAHVFLSWPLGHAEDRAKLSLPQVSGVWLLHVCPSLCKGAVAQWGGISSLNFRSWGDGDTKGRLCCSGSDFISLSSTKLETDVQARPASKKLLGGSKMTSAPGPVPQTGLAAFCWAVQVQRQGSLCPALGMLPHLLRTAVQQLPLRLGSSCLLMVLPALHL